MPDAYRPLTDSGAGWPVTDALGDALDRATRALWSTRRADGSWDERSDSGPASTANVLVVLHQARVLPARDLSAGASWLKARQRPDSSFVAHPFASGGSLSVTAQCWAALHPDPGSTGAASNAARYVMSHGRIPQLLADIGSGDPAAIHLALRTRRSSTAPVPTHSLGAVGSCRRRHQPPRSLRHRHRRAPVVADRPGPSRPEGDGSDRASGVSTGR